MPPPRRIHHYIRFEAWAGFAPAYSGFADRRVDFFATRPLNLKRERGDSACNLKYRLNISYFRCNNRSPLVSRPYINLKSRKLSREEYLNWYAPFALPC